MAKRLKIMLSAGLACCLLAGGLLFQAITLQAPAAINYLESGKTSFKAGHYDYAIDKFKKAVEQNPNDTVAIFYLALAYGKMNQPATAKPLFEKVVEMEEVKRLRGQPYDKNLIEKARTNMAVLVKQQITTTSSSAKAKTIVNKHAGKTDNYLTYALHDGGAVVRWETSKMPIKVYVESGNSVPGFTAEYYKAVDFAMSTWTSASQNVIRFKKVANKNEADIVVRWQRNMSHQQVGLSPLKVFKGTILQSDVHLATYHAQTGQPLSYGAVQSTAIHEFGHALGIRNHSPFPDDIMFFTQNPTQDAVLSFRDKNTIRLLYQQEADITNKGNVSTANANQVFEYLRESNQYLVSDPAKALSILEKAARIDATNVDVKYGMGLCYYNLGVAAGRAKQWPSAKSNFSRAVALLGAVATSKNPPAEVHQHLASAQQSLAALNQN